MRKIMLLAILLFVNAAQAEVTPAEDQLVRSYMQEVLKFSLQPVTQERIRKQITSFNQHVDVGVEESGAFKFKASNRWINATAAGKQAYNNVISFFISQIFVNKFRELLLSVGNKELAEKIRIDAQKGASMKIKVVQDDKRRILNVVLFPEIVPVAYHGKVTVDLQVEDGKIVDVLLGDRQISEKSGTTEATLRKTVMFILRSNTSQFITYDAQVERQIQRSGSDAVFAYTQHFVRKYQNTLQTHHAAKGDLTLDFLLY